MTLHNDVIIYDVIEEKFINIRKIDFVYWCL